MLSLTTFPSVTLSSRDGGAEKKEHYSWLTNSAVWIDVVAVWINVDLLPASDLIGGRVQA